MSTWDQLASLPLEIERYDLEGRELAFSEEFVRYTTLITLRGGGEEGVGEDVVYDGLDHVSFQAAGAVLPLAGSWTLGSFAEHLSELDAFPDPPVARRLAPLPQLGLRVGGARPGAATGRVARSPSISGRELRPLNYVVSMRLGAARQRRARDLRAHAARARALPEHALQARPHQHLERRADRGAGGVGRGRLARPQGPVQGHAGRRGDRPRAVRASWSRRSRTPGSRIRTSPTRRARSSSRTATA